MSGRVFITGASGFVGGHLINALRREPRRIGVLSHRRRLPLFDACEAVSGDINDFPLLVRSLKDTDLLFHLASALGGSLIDPGEFARINIQGTDTVLRAADEAGVKTIVHFSSAGVLGKVPPGAVADEGHALNPQTVYDRTKCEGERIALRYAENGLDVRIVRPGWIYGPGDRRTFKLIRAVAKKRFLMVTRGTALQTPVYIDDLIRGALECAAKGGRGEIYNLSGEEALSVKTMVGTIAEAVGTRLPPVYLPLFPTGAAAWILEKSFRAFRKEAPLTRGKLAFFIHPKPLSIRKAARTLGYQPQVSFKEGMAAAVAWYRSQGWLD